MKTITTGIMIVKDGKGWGVAHRDGYATSYGWVPFDDAIVYNLVEGKPPAYYTGNYMGCNDREIAGAVVKKVRVSKETEVIEEAV